MTDIPDPITALRNNYRTALDEQAALATEARALAARVTEVTAGLTLAGRRVIAYRAMLDAITKAQATRNETPTTPETP